MGPARIVDPIYTPRFTLRPLTQDHVTSRYCGWFDDKSVSEYIEAAKSDHSMESLRAYIRLREQRDDVLFLGIFTRAGQEHIGNIKYEPVDRTHGFAVMGMLIGEREWRGKGVAEEVIRHSGAWLQQKRAIKEIVLGVAPDHVAAISAYEKAGFRQEQTNRIVIDSSVSISMVLHLDV